MKKYHISQVDIYTPMYDNDNDLPLTIKQYYEKHGDIPDNSYISHENFSPNNRINIISFSVKNDKLVITRNDYKDLGDCTIYFSSGNLKFVDEQIPPAMLYSKGIIVQNPKVGESISLFDLGVNRADLNKEVYSFKYNEFRNQFEMIDDSIKVYICKNSTLFVDFSGVESKMITFRKSAIFRSSYKIILDLDDNKRIYGDISISSDKLKNGIKNPILADALRHQSFLVQCGDNPDLYYRVIEFRKSTFSEFEDIAKFNKVSNVFENDYLIKSGSEIYYSLEDITINEDEIILNWRLPDGKKGKVVINKKNSEYTVVSLDDLLDDMPVEQLVKKLMDEFIDKLKFSDS